MLTKEGSNKMLRKQQNGWLKADEQKKKDIFEFGEGYKRFLNIAKTEREFVNEKS